MKKYKIKKPAQLAEFVAAWARNRLAYKVDISRADFEKVMAGEMEIDIVHALILLGTLKVAPAAFWDMLGTSLADVMSRDPLNQDLWPASVKVEGGKPN